METTARTGFQRNEQGIQRMPQARGQGETNRNLKACLIIRGIGDLQVGVSVVGVRENVLAGRQD